MYKKSLIWIHDHFNIQLQFFIDFIDNKSNYIVFQLKVIHSKIKYRN